MTALSEATAHSSDATLENDYLASVELLDTATREPRPNAGAIARVYANLAYLRGYCDANARAFEGIASKVRQELSLRDELVLSALRRSVASSADEEALRASWIDWLEARIADDAVVQTCERKRIQAVDALERADFAQAAVLDRLKLRTDASVAGPVALFSALVRIENASTREKLMRAWREARDEPAVSAVHFLDRHLSLKRDLARRRGFASVLERTLSRGECLEAEIAAFLERYARAAVESHRRFSERVAADRGGSTEPLAHFPRFLAEEAKGANLVSFDFERCLEFLLARFSEHLGAHGRIERRGGILDVEIWCEGKRLGLISIDRSDSDWAPRLSFPDEPWARVLRHTRLRETGRETLSFDAVQSLYHECGHALSHVLGRHPRASACGVDCVPAERLEWLSSWSEMWAFHEAFDAPLHGGVQALARCRKIKALEFERGRLERAATSLLDFELHRSNELGLQATFEAASAQWPDVFQFSLAELAHHFATLSFAENAGASFAYLWGASAAAQWHRLAVIGDGATATLQSSILSSEVTAPPVLASFEFYGKHIQWGTS